LERLKDKQKECEELVIKMNDEIKKLTSKREDELKIFDEGTECLKIETEKLDKNSSNKALEDIKIKYEEAIKNLEEAENDVNAFINNTGVDEDNIVDFLKLTNSLMPASLNGIVNAQKLNELMKNVKILLERRLTDKLTIQECFTVAQVKQEIIRALTDAGGYYMDDIQVAVQDFDNDIKPLLPKSEDGKELPAIMMKKNKKIMYN